MRLKEVAVKTNKQTKQPERPPLARPSVQSRRLVTRLQLAASCFGQLVCRSLGPPRAASAFGAELRGGREEGLFFYCQTNTTNETVLYLNSTSSCIGRSWPSEKDSLVAFPLQQLQLFALCTAKLIAA